MHAPYGRTTGRSVGHVLLDSLDVHCDYRLLQASGCRGSLPWSGQHKRKWKRHKGLSLLPVGFVLPSVPGKSQHLSLRVLSAVAELRKAIMSFSMSVCLCVCPSVSPPALSNSAPTGRIFTKFGICVFFENLPRKLNFH